MISFPNAKINIGLQVIEKREDGFHNIQSIFYPIPLNDILEIIPSKMKTNLSLSGMELDIMPENNLVLKAYHQLSNDFDIPEVQIFLHKVIPTGAGLGGGSSDAAFLLKMLNTLFSLELSQDQLEQYARLLGSDCAFFIRNHPVKAINKGDHFSPLNLQLSGKYLLLVKPAISINTAWAYSRIIPKSEKTDLSNYINQPTNQWQSLLTNDFEKAVFGLYPEIEEIKKKLLAHGAFYASLSGSGSSVFGLFHAPPPKSLKFDQYFQFSCKLSF